MITVKLTSVAATARLSRRGLGYARPVGRLTTNLVAAWRRLEAAIATPRGLGVVAVLALAKYGIESLAWPMARGRDAIEYIRYYAGLPDPHPLLPQLMLFRTPVAPLLFGGTLDLGGGILTEIVMALLYAAAVSALVVAALSFGPRAGLVTACALLVYPAYSTLYHGVQSDGVAACLFAFLILAIVRSLAAPRLWKFAVTGLAVVLLTLTRPGNEVLVAVALVPLLLRAPWRTRVVYAAACLGVAVAGLSAWAGVNDLRYGQFTVARAGNAQALYRLFVYEGLVRPENGPDSRKLAEAVRTDLLPLEPYRTYGITYDRFFREHDSRMWSDLVSLSDRKFGWNTDYRTMRGAAIEAIRRRPLTFARSLQGSIRLELSQTFTKPAEHPEKPQPVRTESLNGRRVLVPTEGKSIPLAHLDWLQSTPDGNIYWDWSSLTNPRMMFRRAGDAQRYVRFERRVAGLMDDLPNRRGSETVASVLNEISKLYPRMILWLLVGIVAALLRRGRGLLVPAIVAGLGLLVVVATALVQPATVAYRLPFDPAFILFSAVALVGAAPGSPLAVWRREGRRDSGGP
jgi:hypothetical protein